MRKADTGGNIAVLSRVEYTKQNAEMFRSGVGNAAHNLGVLEALAALA